MVGIPWTDKDVDLQFMRERLPEYDSIHALCVARRVNHEKNAFLQRVYDEYEKTFPGRMATWTLSKIGTDGPEKKRKKKVMKVLKLLPDAISYTYLVYAQRFRDWFTNHIDSRASESGSKKQEVLHLTETTNSRRELGFHAHARIGGEAMKERIKKDYEDHVQECKLTGSEPMAFIARRNAFLSKDLKERSEDFQKMVESSRNEAGSQGAGRKFVTFLDLTNSVDEDERMKNAALLQE